MAVEDEVKRVLSLLKRAIRSSDLSQKEVDRRIGVRPGYLSQVMFGRLDLKLKHLLAALAAIGVDSAGFFDLAFPAGGGREPRGTELLRLLPGPATAPPAAPPPQAGISEAQLRRLVAKALAQELGIDSEDPPAVRPGGGRAPERG